MGINCSYGTGVEVSVGVIVGIINGVEVACGTGVFTGGREKLNPPRNLLSENSPGSGNSYMERYGFYQN